MNGMVDDGSRICLLWFRRLAALTEERRPQGWETEIRKGAHGLVAPP